RRWNAGIDGAELILGVRYVHHRESLDIFTDDDGLTFRDLDGNPDPRRQATFTSQVRNNIVAPQVGFEYSTQLPSCGCLLKSLWFGASGKAGVGANFVEFRQRLVRGDGFRGFDTRSNTTGLGQVYDVGAFVDVQLLERCRFRAGYNAIWLVDVATSNDQIDFNLAFPGNVRSKQGSVLYHGRSFELQFLF